MSDQCEYCSCKGDLALCESSTCGQHENWYTKNLQSEISALKARLGETEKRAIDDLWEYLDDQAMLALENQQSWNASAIFHTMEIIKAKFQKGVEGES